MHGLALKAVKLFVEDCFDQKAWEQVLQHANCADCGCDPLLEYDAEVEKAIMSALERVLRRPIHEILEDLGTYLVTHPNTEAVRRLMRFCGVTFKEFLHSLDDLPDRVRLAVPDFHLPKIEIREHTARYFSLTCSGSRFGFGHVMTGMLRTMADDYGALAVVEYRAGGQGIEVIEISLLETTFAEGRDFSLGSDAA